MADLSTEFVGLALKSPVVVGACPISERIENIQKAEDAGAGAVVIYSLFQEQIEIERLYVDEALNVGSESFPEALTYFPRLEHASSREHVMWVKKTRNSVSLPLIGSLNATSIGNWVEYAKHLEDAGCDALEINIYAVQADPEKTSSAVEEEALDVVGAVKSSVSVPVVVKLSPFYTSIANFAKRLADAGADGLVLFNRFYQPTINTDTESLEAGLTYSVPSEQRLPLRWIAILSAQLETDIAASTGVYSGFDAVRYILAGAKVVQVVSSLLQRGIGHVAKINHEISKWMDSKGYNKLQDFRGKLNQRGIKDPFAFERAQYIRALRSFGG